MSDRLSAIEALQREIDKAKAYLGLRVETRPLVNKYICALEYALAEATYQAAFVERGGSPAESAEQGLDNARAKLYEALQQ